MESFDRGYNKWVEAEQRLAICTAVLLINNSDRLPIGIYMVISHCSHSEVRYLRKVFLLSKSIIDMINTVSSQRARELVEKAIQRPSLLIPRPLPNGPHFD